MKNKEYEALQQKLSSLVSQKFRNVINHKQSMHWSNLIMSSIILIAIIAYGSICFDEISSNKIHAAIVIIIFLGFIIIWGVAAAGLDKTPDKYVQKHLEETRDIAQSTGSKNMVTLCNDILESLTVAQKRRIESGADKVIWNIDLSISDFAYKNGGNHV